MSTNNTEMPIKMQDSLRAIEFGSVLKSVHVPKQLYEVTRTHTANLNVQKTSGGGGSKNR